MSHPPIVSAEEWQAALAALRVKEKEATRARDALAAQRRRLPMTEIEKDYAFDGPDGRVGLPDLFDGRSQLVVYHFMLTPGDRHVCEGCAMFTDTIGHLAHLHARDTSLVLVSRAPLAEITPIREHLGWTVPWVSSHPSDFNADLGLIPGGRDTFGLSVFFREGDRVFRTYFTDGRGVESLGNHWSFLDLTPLGRQETWERSPEGYRQTAPYEWWRLHDDY